MTSKTGVVPKGTPRKLPLDFFELEVITNRPDPRMGDRDLLEEDPH